MKTPQLKTLLAVAVSITAVTSSRAATWTGATDASWATASNWTGTPPDNTTAQTIDFGTGAVVNPTQTLDASYQVTSITNGSTTDVVINPGASAGTNAINLAESSTTVAAINVSTANLTIAAGTDIFFVKPINSGTTTSLWTAAAGRTLTVNSNISLINANVIAPATNPVTLVINGSGAVNLGGNISGTGGNISIGIANSTATLAVTMSGTGSYTGITRVNTGTLLLASNTALGTSRVDHTGTGVVASSSSAAITLANAFNLTTGNALTFGQLSGGTGLITLNGGITLSTSGGSRTIATNVDTTVNGVVGGNSNATFTKSGAAKLILANTANTFLTNSGAGRGVAVTGGTLSVTRLANAGVNSSIGRTSNVATEASIFLDGGAVLEYINGGAAASSTDRLLRIGNTTAGGSGSLLNNATSSAETVTFSNTNALAYGTANQTRSITFGGSNTGANAFAMAINDNGTGLVSVTKSGSGNWTLSGNSLYSGGTTVTSGTLSAGSATALGAGAVTVSGGALNLGGFAVANAISVGASGKLIGAANQSLANVTFADGAALTGSFGSFDAGTSAAKVYNVTGGAAFSGLSGQGTFTGGLVTLAGTHAPGNSPGTQTFANGLAYGDGAVVNLEIASDGLTADSIVVQNGLTIGTGVSLNVSLFGTADYSTAFWDADHTYTLISVSGGTTGSFSSLANTLGGGLEGAWSLVQDINGVTATWTAVAIPEPSAYGVLGAGALSAAAMVRLRRRRAAAKAVS